MPIIPPAYTTNNFHPVAQVASLAHEQLASHGANGLQVICAWPVSGQYGPGSRFLYYVLIAACIFARKSEWLRSAALAAALLFPAVAALHGIVLAALHNSEAVDMDVYGAFQLCSVGILAAPVTVRLSRTYFDNPGRNTIFVWALLVLAGLLSLTIEFYRISTKTCPSSQPGATLPMSTNMINLLNNPPTCDLACSVDAGPFSVLRGGSANNIYVIPAPYVFSFSTATLLAAACCVPAVLLLVAMWLQVMEMSWRAKFGRNEESTLGPKKPAGKFVRMFRKFLEVPLFTAAIVAIVVIGERNFFSLPVRYQTEPMANVGQWAPIVGIVLGLMGSFYLVLAEAVEEEAKKQACSRAGSRRTSLALADSQQIRERRMSVHPPEPATDFVNARASYLLHALARGIVAFRAHFSPSQTTFDESDFRQGRAGNAFPEVPGEEARNRDLSRIRTGYTVSIHEEEEMRRERSRTMSSSSNLGRPSLAVESPPQTPTSPPAPPPAMVQRRRSTLELPVEILGSGRRRSSSPARMGAVRPPPLAVVTAPDIVISESPTSSLPSTPAG